MSIEDKDATGDVPTMDSYGESARSLISVRSAEKDAAFFLPYLKQGMKLLDCGCGEGTITVGLAEAVAPGSVIGIDLASDAIERARRLANERGLTNLEFREASIYQLPFPNDSFDAVLAHSIFEHIGDWPIAMGEIKRVVKSGGIVGVRSPDWGAMITEPFSPVLERFWSLMYRIRGELGGRGNAGRQLPCLLSQMGFARIKAEASFESFGAEETRQWWGNIWAGFSLDGPYPKEWLKRGWIEEKETQEFYDAWKEWAEQPGGFAADSWCEAVGWKE